MSHSSNWPFYPLCYDLKTRKGLQQFPQLCNFYKHQFFASVNASVGGLALVEYLGKDTRNAISNMINEISGHPKCYSIS